LFGSLRCNDGFPETLKSVFRADLEDGSWCRPTSKFHCPAWAVRLPMRFPFRLMNPITAHDIDRNDSRECPDLFRQMRTDDQLFYTVDHRGCPVRHASEARPIAFIVEKILFSDPTDCRRDLVVLWAARMSRVSGSRSSAVSRELSSTPNCLQPSSLKNGISVVSPCNIVNKLLGTRDNICGAAHMKATFVDQFECHLKYFEFRLVMGHFRSKSLQRFYRSVFFDCSIGFFRQELVWHFIQLLEIELITGSIGFTSMKSHAAVRLRGSDYCPSKCRHWRQETESKFALDLSMVPSKTDDGGRISLNKIFWIAVLVCESGSQFLRYLCYCTFQWRQKHIWDFHPTVMNLTGRCVVGLKRESVRISHQLWSDWNVLDSSVIALTGNAVQILQYSGKSSQINWSQASECVWFDCFAQTGWAGGFRRKIADGDTVVLF
jgi:hypothetical protein